MRAPLLLLAAFKFAASTSLSVAADPAAGAPVVCINSEASSGTCTDSHDPFSHVWPAPVRATAAAVGETPAATLTNASLHFVATGGGAMLQRAVTRYHAAVFAPVMEGALPLAAFLERAKLSKHQASLEEEGYADTADIIEATDDDLAGCGLKKPELRRLRRTLAELGGGGAAGAPPATSAGTSSPAVTLSITVRDSESALPATEQDESYELHVDVSGGGTLRANTTVGAIRGLETYSQLIEYSDDGDVQLWALPITVSDRPHWKYRGIKQDTSRHFIRLPHLRNIIRAMEARRAGLCGLLPRQYQRIG